VRRAGPVEVAIEEGRRGRFGRRRLAMDEHEFCRQSWRSSGGIGKRRRNNFFFFFLFFSQATGKFCRRGFVRKPSTSASGLRVE